MRKLENAIVGAAMECDLAKALSTLKVLVSLDRRRAWWAVFRIAADQLPDERKRAMLSLVGKTYIARRSGRLIGVDDSQVLDVLLRWLSMPGWDHEHATLTEAENRLLQTWLPARLRFIWADPPSHHQ